MLEDKYFGSLTGAKRSVKEESARQIKARKMSALRRMLNFLVDNTSSWDGMEELLENVDVLGKEGTGYFWLYEKSTSSKGKQNCFSFAVS